MESDAFSNLQTTGISCGLLLFSYSDRFLGTLEKYEAKHALCHQCSGETRPGWQHLLSLPFPSAACADTNQFEIIVGIYVLPVPRQRPWTMLNMYPSGSDLSACGPLWNISNFSAPPPPGTCSRTPGAYLKPQPSLIVFFLYKHPCNKVQCIN